MKTRLVFIEGLPGSGKTILAKRLYDHLKSADFKVSLYQEGDINPLSYLWQVVLREDQLNHILRMYPNMKESILEHTQKVGKNHILAFTKVDVPKEYKNFFQTMQKYEVNKKPKEEFQSLYQSLYQSFPQNAQSKDETYLFECTLLQNHVNQLFAVYGLEDQEVIKHIGSLLDNLSDYHPIILYIKQTNIPSTLDRISKERISPNKDMHSDWIDMAIQYTEQTVFGKKNSLKGRKLLLDYLRTRQCLEEKILQELEVESHIVPLDEDYDLVYQNLLDILKRK